MAQPVPARIALGVLSVCVYWGLDLYFDRNLAFGTVLYSAVWATIVVALLPLWRTSSTSSRRCAFLS